MDFVYGQHAGEEARNENFDAALEYLIVNLETDSLQDATRIIRDRPGHGGFLGWLKLLDKDPEFPSLEAALQGSVEAAREITLLFVKAQFCYYPCFKSAQFFFELASKYEDYVEMSHHYEFYSNCLDSIWERLPRTKKWWTQKEDQKLALRRIMSAIEEEIPRKVSSSSPSKLVLASMLADDGKPYVSHKEAIGLYLEHFENWEPESLAERIQALFHFLTFANSYTKIEPPSYTDAGYWCHRMGSELEIAFLELVAALETDDLLPMQLMSAKLMHVSLCAEIYLLGPDESEDTESYRMWATMRVVERDKARLIEKYGIEKFNQEILGDRTESWVLQNREFTYEETLANNILRTERLGLYWQGRDGERDLVQE